MAELGLVLGTFALTSALAYSDGPWGLFYKLRNIKPIQDFGLLECYVCLSLWVSIVLCE